MSALYQMDRWLIDWMITFTVHLYFDRREEREMDLEGRVCVCVRGELTSVITKLRVVCGWGCHSPRGGNGAFVCVFGGGGEWIGQRCHSNTEDVREPCALRFCRLLSSSISPSLCLFFFLSSLHSHSTAQTYQEMALLRGCHANCLQPWWWAEGSVIMTLLSLG